MPSLLVRILRISIGFPRIFVNPLSKTVNGSFSIKRCYSLTFSLWKLSNFTMSNYFGLWVIFLKSCWEITALILVTPSLTTYLPLIWTGAFFLESSWGCLSSGASSSSFTYVIWRTRFLFEKTFKLGSASSLRSQIPFLVKVLGAVPLLCGA